MPFKKNDARQSPISAYVDVNAADLVNGQALAAIELPGGAVIQHGAVDVLTAFNSATSDTLNVGDAANGSRYLGNGNLHQAGRIPLVPTGLECQTNTNLTVNWSGSGAPPTAGKFRLTVTYIVTNRSEFTQG